jgi:hypothetical protein
MNNLATVQIELNNGDQLQEAKDALDKNGNRYVVFGTDFELDAEGCDIQLLICDLKMLLEINGIEADVVELM